MRRSSTEASGMLSPDEAEAHAAELAAELAEAEAAEAEARAEAARAKATAARLRDSDPGPEDGGPEGNTDKSGCRTSRSRWRVIGLAAAALMICGFLSVTGLMVWQHEKVSKQHARDADFVTAAEKGVLALLSIDYNHAKVDVQRVIDTSTGSFKDDFSRDADSFVKTAEESKAVTVGSISAAALQSVDGDSGTVILAVSSLVSNSSGAQQDPRAWRMSVTVTRDGDQLKMSNVEFVP